MEIQDDENDSVAIRHVPRDKMSFGRRGGERFCPSPEGSRKIRMFCFINNTTSFCVGNSGHTPEERAKTVLDHSQKVHL